MLATLCALFCLTACSDSDDNPNEGNIVNPSPKEQWGKTLVGSDGTIFAYPDLYVNYWEYTWDTDPEGENKDIALCI